MILFRFCLLLAMCASTPLLTNAQAADNACKPLWDATFARARVPYRSIIDTTQQGRKPIHSEEIFTADAWYRKFDTRWIRTPTTPQQQIDGMRSLNATFTDCRRVGDATLNNEPVAIYSAKTSNTTLIPVSGTLKMWISVKRHLPVRTEADASVPFLGQSHTVKTYVYDKIKPPM